MGISQPLIVRGKKFASIQDAAAAYGIHKSVVARRLRTGWSIYEALGLSPPPPRVAHNRSEIRTSLGTYQSISAAADAHGVEPGTVIARLAKGWPTEHALGLVSRERMEKRGRTLFFRGARYESIKALASAFKKSGALVRKRLNSGWTIEQALDLTPPPPRFRNQVGGARDHHWRNTEVVDDRAFPATEQGHYKVYVIRNLKTGKEYVGITIGDLKARLRGHRANARRGVKSKLYNSMRRYSVGCFEIELIRNDANSFAELQKQEATEIVARGTLIAGYNVSPGGEIGTPKAIRIGDRLFASHSEAANHFGISVGQFNLRIGRLKWTPEQAAEIEPRDKGAWRKIRVAGRSFRSLKAAAEHFDRPWKLVHSRVTKSGWSIRQALELDAPPAEKRYSGVRVVAFGESFSSYAACAKHFGVKPESLRKRIVNLGDAPELALRRLMSIKAQK